MYVLSDDARRGLRDEAVRKGWQVNFRVATEESTVAETVGGDVVTQLHYRVEISAYLLTGTSIDSTVRSLDEDEAQSIVRNLIEALPPREK